MAKIKWTPRKRRAFLKSLAETGNVSAAARASNVSRSHAYALKQSDPDFSDEWRDALESATDLLEAEARHRAVDGVETPHFHQGKVAGSVRRYSDSLLMFLLKAHRPEKFRDRPAERKGSEDGDLDRQIEDAKATLGEQLSRLDAGDEPG